MTQEIIDVGAAPNDGQGDPIRTAFIKCNTNFTQLFSIYTTVPSTLTGTSADIAGMYANDANYFYYCFADWTSPGTAIIWAKMSEVDTTSYISNGNTSVAIPTTNGNILFDVGNVSNVMVMTTDGFTLTGNALVSKNLTVTGNSTIGGNEVVNGYLTVVTDAYIGGNSSIVNNLDVGGNLLIQQKSTFNDNVVVNGNLEVNGNLTYINVENLKVTDPLIQLAANNSSSDSIDVGFYGEWNDGVFQYGGLARDASDGDWKLFSNVIPQPTTVVDFTNAVYDNLQIGDLKSENIFNSGNVSVTGNVNVTANVNANNATITSNVVVGGNIIGGNIRSLGNVDVVGNINANNATITTNVVVGGNIIGGNIRSLGNVDVVGNINANNATITTNVVVGGNIIGGNIASLGNVDVVGNVNANNATITNNVVAGGNVTATGLVTSGLYWANGSPIISNTGNIIVNNITVGANANIAGNIYGTNAILSGALSTVGNISTAATSNISTGNLITSGQVIAAGNVNGLNIVTPGNVVAGGDISANNASFSKVLSVGGDAFIIGDISANNASFGNDLAVGGNAVIVGDISANNASFGNDVDVGGTMFVGNIIPNANVTYTLGNSTRQWKDLWVSNSTIFINSIPLTMSNASVLLWNTVPLISSVTDQDLTTTGNVKAANLIAAGLYWGNGNPIISNTGSFTGDNINIVGNISAGGFSAITGNSSAANFNTTGNVVSGNVVTGNVVAGNLIGNVIATAASIGNLGFAGNIISTSTPSITLDPLSDGGSLGTVFILGNLQVTGNVTTVNSTTVTTDSLLYQAANNAINSTAASGGGLAIGPAGSSYATWTFNSVSNSWVSNLPIVATGGANVNGPITNVTNLSANGNISTSNLTVTGTANLSTANVQIYSLGVGTAASGVLGEIRAANNVTGYYSSDSKFKENITDISQPTDRVKAIGGKMFDWTDEYIADRGGLDDYFLHKHDFGVIAQDVQRVLPEAVRTRPDGSLAVDYPKLSALAFAAINELSDKFSREIAELRSEIEKLKGK